MNLIWRRVPTKRSSLGQDERGRGESEGIGQNVAARRERIECGVGGGTYQWDQRFNLASGWEAAVSMANRT